MVIRRTFIIAFTVVSVTILSGTLNAQNYGNNNDLKGFDTLYVLVENLEPELVGIGLTASEIQSGTEAKLRTANLNIRKPSPIYLYVKVGVIKTKLGLAGDIVVGLKQRVILSRDTSVYFPANTWESTGLYVTDIESAKSNITRAIAGHIDRFVKAYREANSIVTRTEPNADPEANEESPFSATYVGGDREPVVEVFNDSNRTLYLDLGKARMTAYVIESGKSISIPLTEGNWNYKATALGVRPLTGADLFRRGYTYTWRFRIITVRR